MRANEPTAVYRLFNAGRDLLYVGMSSSPGTRWESHARSQPWWAPDRVALCEVVWYETRPKAAEAERQAIRTENPRYNVLLAKRTNADQKADRHRNPAVIFRLPPEDKQWLADYADRIGRDVNAICTDILADLRRRVTRRSGQRPGHLDSS